MSGTSNSRLDQAVKGAAPLGTSTAALLSSRPSTPSSRDSAINANQMTGTDLLATLPSSPPQIYLNLLILEASLRSQYLTLRDRRRQNTFFILLLVLWTAYFSWALFLAPREDGSGIGGSVYWVVETGQKVALMGGIVTGLLILGTGQWDRGVRRPRRFVGVTNRGLRTMNCKIVVIKGPWWREMAGHLAFLFPWTSYFFAGGPGEYTDFRVVEHGAGVLSFSEKPRLPGQAPARQSIHFADGLEYIPGEDISPGGDHIKLLLLSRPFSPDFRENWDLYRTEYWERENERRAQLRQKLSELDRARAREEGGWLGWLGWRGWHRRNVIDVEKRHIRPAGEKRTASGRRAEGSHSRSASRSSLAGSEERPVSRGSTASTRRGSVVGQDGRRRSTRNSMSGLGSPMSAAATAVQPPPKRSSLAAPPLTRGDSFTPLGHSAGP